MFGLVADDGLTTSVVLNFLFCSRGSVLLPSFTWGAGVPYYRHAIPASWPIAIALFLLATLVVLVTTVHSANMLSYITVPIILYLTMFIGILNVPKLPIYRRGNCSYGIHLYAFPIQQSLLTVLKPLMFHPLVHVFCIFGIGSCIRIVLLAPSLRSRSCANEKLQLCRSQDSLRILTPALGSVD